MLIITLYFIIQADPSKITAEQIISDIGTILIPENEYGLINRQHHLNDDESEILDLLCAMYECQDRILISNTCDNWESDHNTLNSLLDCAAQVKDAFCFTNFVPDQDQFGSIVTIWYDRNSLKEGQFINFEANYEQLEIGCDELRDKISKNRDCLKLKQSDLSSILNNTSALEEAQRA